MNTGKLNEKGWLFTCTDAGRKRGGNCTLLMRGGFGRGNRDPAGAVSFISSSWKTLGGTTIGFGDSSSTENTCL